MNNILTTADVLALAFFIAAWAAYHVLLGHGPGAARGLNHQMNRYRIRWMLEMSERDVRIVDASLMGSLQNGSAFFASTSLLAIGGTATLLRAADDVLKVFSDLPFGPGASRQIWEVKIIGLLIIFGYAFFKFAWSYRLFNYAAILVGATPSRTSADQRERRRIAMRAAQMNIAAGRHFTRGQRAFFFALAYFGWFLGPWAFVATTAAVLVVMSARQFVSDAQHAVMYEPPEKPET
ncbi:MAG: DUF599 family protein [Beijerinckiaceae bacterium]|nr:DUF599 family protein [Beijerinckiaceae bacterium]MDO9440495.1 DUF599 family protein [Beijerinckiaceae bacterium]